MPNSSSSHRRGHQFDWDPEQQSEASPLPRQHTQARPRDQRRTHASPQESPHMSRRWTASPVEKAPRKNRRALSPLVYAGGLVTAGLLSVALISLNGDNLVSSVITANSAPLEFSRFQQDTGAPSGLQSAAPPRYSPSGGAIAAVPTFTPTSVPILPPETLAPTETTAPTPEPVSEPVPEPTATPEPPTPTAEPTPLPATVALSGFRHMWQTFNNCGPATLAMNLSYFGSTLSQADIGAAIRHPEDKNVNAEELAAYARQQGFGAQARVNGSDDLVRAFLSHGIPVLIETWLQPEPNDGFGHYRLLTGYDDVNQRWIAHDSYVGDNRVSPDPAVYAGIYLPYAETDRLWAVYNRAYVLVYQPDQADLVQSILGDEAEPAAMWQATLRRAQQDLATEQAQGNVSAFTWFNLGGALHNLGRHEEAAVAFDQARAIGLPWRMLWYQFEPFAAYYAVGRYQDVVDLARTTLNTMRTLEEVQTWYGKGLAALGDTAGARAALTYALQMNPNVEGAQEALDALN